MATTTTQLAGSSLCDPILFANLREVASGITVSLCAQCPQEQAGWRQLVGLMWYRFGLLTFLFIMLSQPTLADAPAEVLSNASVVELKELGLGDGVIIEKIKASKCKFDLRVDDLKALKSANVSDAVISAMLSASKPANSAPAVAANQTTETGVVPKFYGLHAVVGNRLIDLKSESTTVEVPSDVEFIYYSKTASVAEMFGLFAIPSADKPVPTVRDGKYKGMDDFLKQSEEFSAEMRGQLTGLPRGSVQLELRGQSVAGQPEMIRLKPATPLRSGKYQIGIRGGSWYRFSASSRQLAPTSSIGRGEESLAESDFGFQLDRVVDASVAPSELPPVNVHFVLSKGDHTRVILRISNLSNKRIKVTGMTSRAVDGKSIYSKLSRSIPANNSHDFLAARADVKGDETVEIHCDGFAQTASFIVRKRGTTQ